ncbi:MAG: RHS repeat-associated core domain-containing protein [Calothrix sp. MO_167.B42]|nr:RHS repeat-associated core domain-containing protein [Calothrix sp. MO_167.B42]
MTDNQGTVRDVVDATGVVVNHITYDSFGGVTGESNTAVDFRFGYTGREFDEETGLYYYRARYYDAATGRFISQDPIGFEAGDGNLYRYVFNSPTNFNDYSGEAVIALTATVGGGLFLAAGGLLILSNPQAQEVIPQLPQRISNLFKFFDTTPNPDFDSNNINRGKTPDFLPDPLVGGGFRLGIHDFNPNDINIHDGIPVRFPDTLTFPLGDFECLFPPFFEANGFGAGANLPSMDGLPEPRVKETLINHGFQPTKPQPTKGSWQTFKHPDGSKVDIHWSTGRIVRTEAPIYGEDGSRINRGQRLDSQGNRIPLEIRHEQHPKETVDNSGV